MAEYEEYLHTALELARQAGDIIRTAWTREAVSVEHKGAVDLVTETDKAVEDLLVAQLKARYPNHCFLAEESFTGTSYNFSDTPTWIMCDFLQLC